MKFDELAVKRYLILLEWYCKVKVGILRYDQKILTRSVEAKSFKGNLLIINLHTPSYYNNMLLLEKDAVCIHDVSIIFLGFWLYKWSF